jgi:hypothetical protein
METVTAFFVLLMLASVSIGCFALALLVLFLIYSEIRKDW